MLTLFDTQEQTMPAVLEVEATLTSKGQITLPAALRAKLGLVEGSKVKFSYDGKKTTLTPELPISAYRGILRHLGDIDTSIPKEPDRF
jgi:AbrB family looped-hinge helix DNA binding protein